MPSRRIVINHRVCEGCGDCGDVSNCLSVQPVETPLGRKTTIDQASCNVDYSCLKGDCPAFMTVEVDDDAASPSPSGAAPVAGRPVPDPIPTTPPDLVRIRLAGIGGTGVVTVAQILATAAMFDGWEVRGLDQTGLSQKAGPVISDVVLARDDHGSSNLVGRGQADLLLGFDALVAAGDAAISGATDDRTVVVASTAATPTGAMITEPATIYPTGSIEDRLDNRSDGARNRFVDATGLASALTGNPAGANLFLLGVALQAGSIPVSTDAVERAIELNGVAVDTNLAAFDWGRRWAFDPDGVDRLAAASHPASSEPTTIVTVPELPASLANRIRSLSPIGADAADELVDLIDLVELLAADLVGFQDASYAGAFLGHVEAARTAERAVDPGSTILTETVARSLHKLMAYKDEYEVARLLLLPEGTEAARLVGGEQGSVTWRLHPPMLKALGLKGKIGIGSWAAPGLAALGAAKRVRGTRFDPFGRTEMRRLERALPGEFTGAMATVYSSLSVDNLGAAVDIARLPDQVRGYEELKVQRAAEFRSNLAEAMAAFITRPEPSGHAPVG